MKKLFKLFAFAAIFGALSVSCSKEAAAPDEEVAPGADGTEVTTPADDENLPEGMIRLTFAVSAENEADPELKTSWDGTTHSHSWANGDQVRILWGTGGSDYVDADVDVVSGGVSAVVPETAETFYAVYPTTATYALDLTEGKVTITIPRYQSGKFEDANIMAAKTTKADAELNFKNMTSILKFSTGSTDSYNSVSVMANDQTKLTGTVSTTFQSAFSIETATGSDAIVSVQKGEPTGNTGVAANTTYYLAMLPGEAIDNGIGFKIENRGEHTDLLGGGLSKSGFARKRSKVYDLGTLDSRIVTDWYISEAGTDTSNGASATDPAGPKKLMDLLNPSYSTNNTTAGWRLTNATIHVFGGTYNLQELNGGEVFDPHYNLSNLKVHIKGEGDSTNPTKFICNQTADNEHIFAVSGSHKVGDFTFENITFTANPSASNTNSNGVAFNYSGTADVENKITFKNCAFDGLTSTASGTTTFGGSAVFVYSSKAFDILFDGCSFSNNNSSRAAVALCNTGDNGNVSFSGCTFSNNITSNNGGSIYIYANGKTTIDSSTFKGDGTTSMANNGGAITVIKGASVTLQNGCVINKCVSKGNGGAIFNHGNVVIDNSTISNCVGKVGGAIYSDGTVTIKNNSIISENSMYSGGTNGGAIYCVYGTSGSTTPTLDIEKSIISSNTSTNGAAIYGGKGDASHFVVTRVFNTLFKSNVASGGASSGANRNGGCVYATDYNYLLFANCTFSDNTVGTGGIISMGRSGSVDYNKLYLVSSTIDGPNDGIQRNSKVNVVYNSIVLGSKTNTPQNLSINHSIWGTGSQVNIYGASTLQTNGNYTNTATSTDVEFSLGTYSNGVYPLNSAYESLYSQGMSVTDIKAKALTFDNITLTPEQIDLLAEDQKGNPRNGTIMGAYVLNTAPTK